MKKRGILFLLSAICLAVVFLTAGCREGQKSVEKAKEAERAGHYEEAVNWYRTAVSQGEKTAEVYADLALAYAKRSDFTAAEQAMEQAMTASDRSRETDVKRGILFFLEEKYAEAASAFQNGIPEGNDKLSDTDKTALGFLAECKERTGDYAGAVAVYKRMILAGYQTLEAKLGVGLAYVNLHELSAAKTYFDFALEESGVRPEHYLLIYRALHAEEDFLAAEEYFQKGLSSCSSKDGGMTEGEYYANAGKLIVAEEKLTNETSTGALLVKASLAGRDGNYEEAERIFETLLASGKEPVAVYNAYMILKIREGNPEAARDLLKQARSYHDTAAERTLDWNEIILEECAHEYGQAYLLLDAYLEKYGSTPEAEREKLFLSRVFGS